LREDLKIGNAMQVPRITKITINMGVGEAVADRKVMDAAVTDSRRSRTEAAHHEVAQGDRILQAACGTCRGREVTLRGARMYGVPRPA